MTEEVTKLYELKMKKNGWITLPQEIMAKVGSKIIISPTGNGLALRSLSNYAIYEKELRHKVKTDRSLERVVMHVIGSSVEYDVSKSGEFQLSISQREQFDLHGEIVIPLKCNGGLCLSSPDRL